MNLWNSDTMLQSLLVIPVILVIAGFTLIVLNQLLDIRDREAIRQRIEDFWFRTAGMEVLLQFKLALSARYTQMRQLQRLFLAAFILIVTCLTIVGTAETLIKSNYDIKTDFEGLQALDFNVRYLMVFSFDGADDPDLLDPNSPPFFDKDGQCIEGEGAAPFKTIYRYSQVKRALADYLDRHKDEPTTLRFLAVSVYLLGMAFVAIPLAISLWLSFNFTLWLLSKITQSKFSTVAIILIDLVAAVTLPTILSGTFIALFVFSVIQLVGALPDYALFSQPTWTSMLIASTAVSLSPSLGAPVIGALFALALPWQSSWAMLLQSLFQFALANFKTLFSDVSRVIHFDLAIGMVETLINWAIAIDLLFSLFYLLPSLGIVLIQRSPTTRKFFLNAIQYFAEHPLGPLIALSDACTSFAKFAFRLFRGR